MASISKISVAADISKPIAKNIKRAAVALPAVSSLGVLAGASMGPIIPPDNVIVPDGMDVYDPIIDQLQYRGGQLLDLGGDIVGAVGDGIINAADTLSDAAGAAVGAILDWIG